MIGFCTSLRARALAHDWSYHVCGRYSMSAGSVFWR